jgi:hypothetical protein
VVSCPNPTDLMTNPSNKIQSMELNGETISNVSSTSFLTSGLNAKPGSTLLSWTINTQKINDITSIGLTNSPNVQGPIQYQLYDNFDNVVGTTGDKVGQIVPINGEYIDKIVVTTNTPTSDGQPPRNLKLVVNGCFKEESLRTKAQVEVRPTTVAGK